MTYTEMLQSVLLLELQIIHQVVTNGLGDDSEDLTLVHSTFQTYVMDLQQ